MTITRRKFKKCPSCGTITDSDSVAFGEDAKPSPGDVSICLYCAKLLVFGDDLNLKLPTNKQLEEIKADRETWDEIQKVIAGIEMLRNIPE
jgi:phage FluMu protein Com